MPEEEVILECVVCGAEVKPEDGEEFKHVVDSKTGRDLVFCGKDGALLAQLINMDLSENEEVLQEVREIVGEKFEETI